MTATGHPVMNRDKQSDRFSAKSGRRPEFRSAVPLKKYRKIDNEILF